MKKLLFVGLTLAAAVVLWRSHDSDDKLVYDRFWVDHQPKDGKETYQSFYIDGEHPGGRFATQTWWRGAWESFHYHVVPRHPGTIEVIYGDTNESERITLRASKCSENGFDYCLEVTGSSRGAGRYYSRSAWDRHTTQSPPSDQAR